MSRLSLEDLAEEMRDIDFAMLSTHAEGGEIAGRPMSTNRDVAYDGTSYFFTLDSTRTVADIARDPKVALSFTGRKGLFGKPPTFIAVEGRATLIRDRAAFDAHWAKDLDDWFKQGADTPGLVLIQVEAARITCWKGMEETEVEL
ncbi:pyridoxamine 5'-phosphate oxidase family protein [Roseomonas hellenica]|uniref:Pyridoxamine 5'-phosphate oxidase family protein n=1 Tax=Plastoroseomonas hellenica TaxID=2687306 RepID=A0ABS5F5G5_9PROT|nr:pyridoxamine 5'-phosphate oxidase family protein [Plastoroseomonas hellenica]MBR0667365.1 pyridoxamine 5'-phosphate oxidase family protein [Plastoroseomonas hellenica]